MHMGVLKIAFIQTDPKSTESNVPTLVHRLKQGEK